MSPLPPRPSANIVWKPTTDGLGGGTFYVEIGGRWYTMRAMGTGMDGSFAHHPAGSYEPVGWAAKPDPVGSFREAFETGPEKPQEPSKDPLEEIGAHLTDALASGATELLRGAEKGLSAARKWLEDL